MSEFCISSPAKTQFSSLLFSDFMLFCSFILSHPLYFSYFIFFSPYLLKLLSFLSPLFITTSLLLLALLTGFPGLVHANSPQLPESKLGFLLTTYNTVLERFRTKLDDENEGFHDHFEEFEAYRIVFETSSPFEVRENPVQALDLESEENGVLAFEAPVVKCSSHDGSEALTNNLEDHEQPRPEITPPMAGEKRLEDFFQEMEDFESTDSNKVEERKEETLMRSGSKAMGNKINEALAKISDDNGGEYTSKVMEKSRRFGANLGKTENGEEYNSKVMENSETVGANLGSFGSMRKEKEWKRTLACKLFEERHNVEGGGEGMDLLWETYESDSKNKANKGKKGGVEYYEDDEEEEEEVNGQLCCLQALKFSAGKMNLGMGRPNLVRISKALKGIGWLHHVSRHGKKGYN